MYYPTQALKSVKHPSNTVNLDPKRARTLPSLIYFSWDIYRDPTGIILAHLRFSLNVLPGYLIDVSAWVG
jgi:hypothetical protein